MTADLPFNLELFHFLQYMNDLPVRDELPLHYPQAVLLFHLVENGRHIAVFADKHQVAPVIGPRILVGVIITPDFTAFLKAYPPGDERTVAAAKLP